MHTLAQRLRGLTLNLLLPALAATTQIAQAQVSPEKLILPGKAIGPWTLAMSIDDLIRLNGAKKPLGAPEGEAEILLRNLRDSTRDLWAHRWDHLRLRAVTFERTSKAIEGLTSSEPTLRTPEGVGIGSTRAEVEAAYGLPSAVTDANGRQMHMIYDSIGITFRVSNEYSKVELINVFPQNTARQRWKFP